MASEFRTRRWTKPRICVPTPLSVFFIEITFPSSPSPIILFKPHRHLFNYFSSLLPCCFTTLCIHDSFVVQNRSGFAKRFEKVAKSRIVASPLNFRLITYARYLSLSPRPRSVLVNQSKRSVGTHTQYLQYTHPFRFHLWSLNICPLDQSWSNFLLPLVKPTYICDCTMSSILFVRQCVIRFHIRLINFWFDRYATADGKNGDWSLALMSNGNFDFQINHSRWRENFPREILAQVYIVRDINS